MEGLNFEEMGYKNGCKFGKEDFIEHACRYYGVLNPTCICEVNVPSCMKWFSNSRGNTIGVHIVNHLVSTVLIAYMFYYVLIIG